MPQLSDAPFLTSLQKKELQWGRGRMAPENSARSRTPARGGGLQWGRGRMAPENDPPGSSGHGVCSFNGAGAEWPRKTVAIGILAGPYRGFNGAGAEWPRKTTGAPLVAVPPSPLQWGRGRMAPENSARSRTPARGGGLQWGRGRMAPENDQDTVPQASITHASMGPGPNGPGKLVRPYGHHPVFRSLQWGRGRMAPENSLRFSASTSRVRLQWGRGRMAPENII